ncbi:glutamyl-tRNA(Gln) amidotransferase subunit B, mitochondrial [Ischnura elegans]|uniref:glutamyl-tRNA(Gln) amidotransferase subunit B, mitochondrial n=1 Tax=Ischnura elegans TaxID=197161 RepID=UPI001ED8A19E|nr:glutamyl-tRNA(Gln) amidotransferase subunit B, mitochondrial [Ischnura elegans]XP_046390681.1 glutamyl-tRNA(Gln) amidotransferase subunit B, mitochondrial [Ischnura elegans]
MFSKAVLSHLAVIKSYLNVGNEFSRRCYSAAASKWKAKLCSLKEGWEGVVGLEVHAQIMSCSKLFSGAGTTFSSPVNSNVSLFDAAIPGTLPVLNRRCVEAGILTALALSCRLNPVSHFDRKHYFYADLPAGYQITQQRKPLAQSGVLPFEVYATSRKEKLYRKKSNVIQLQLEQDSGKSLHDDLNMRSLVDLNRAGVGLMEIVFAPDLCCGEEAASLVKELSLILSRLGTCTCRMEEGALRVDANVSVRPTGSSQLGARSELKNLGSIRAVAQAVDYEMKRQVEELERGGKVGGDTRSWDAELRMTVPMRDKEIQQDYRFMPDPNLPPLRILNVEESGSESNLQIPAYFRSPNWPPPVDAKVLRDRIPELPSETRMRLRETYGLSVEASNVLVNEEVLLSFFFKVLEGKKGRDPKLIANILINELMTAINKADLNLEQCDISTSSLGEVIDLFHAKSINNQIVRKLVQYVLEGDERSPLKIVRANNWGQITNPKEIQNICNCVLEKNPDLVKQYKAGKTKVFAALLGEVSKSSQQRADMASAAKILKEALKKI